MPVRVLVDGRSLWTDSAHRGLGAYLRGVLPPLAADDRLDVTVLARPGHATPDGVKRREVTRIAGRRLGPLEHDIRCRLERARHTPDVFFSPAQEPPGRRGVPVVQVVHDLIPLVFDDPAFRAEARRWRRHAQRLRAADAVIASSEATAADAVRLLGIARERLHVIPLGVDGSLALRVAPRCGDGVPPTVCMVAGYGPHKGFADACAAIAAVAAVGLPHELVLVGPLTNDPWTQMKVQAVIDASPRPDRVRLVGWVDDVWAEVMRADAVVVASRYEGFGLPALEAMALGVPVVGYANSSVIEVVGDAGVLVSDGDVNALGAALVDVLSSAERRATLSRRGRLRAAPFTWATTAASTADLLAEVVARARA